MRTRNGTKMEPAISTFLKETPRKLHILGDILGHISGPLLGQELVPELTPKHPPNDPGRAKRARKKDWGCTWESVPETGGGGCGLVWSQSTAPRWPGCRCGLTVLLRFPESTPRPPPPWGDRTCPLPWRASSEFLQLLEMCEIRGSRNVPRNGLLSDSRKLQNSLNSLLFGAPANLGSP